MEGGDKGMEQSSARSGRTSQQIANTTPTMTGLHDSTRRTVLKTLGAGVAGATTVVGTATATRGTLVSQISSDGAWVAFPLPVSLNRRSQNPIDLQEEVNKDGETVEGRWVSEPARRGNVRCRVENNGGDPPFPNAGFYVDIGPIGDITSITIDARSVESAGDAAQLTAGILLDVGGDGDYFEWTPLEGNSERFVGFGNDAEGLVLPLSFPSDESFTIDQETGMFPLTSPENETFGDYTTGEGENITTDTEAAIQVSVLGAGAGTVEEAIVEGVTVERS